MVYIPSYQSFAEGQAGNQGASGGGGDQPRRKSSVYIPSYQDFTARYQQGTSVDPAQQLAQKVQEFEKQYKERLKTSSERSKFRKTAEQIANDPNNPESEVAKELLKRIGKSGADTISDFTSASNEALFGGMQRGLVGAVNYVASGFNPEEAGRRTEEFLRTTGQTDEGGTSRLTRGADRESGAFKAGEAVGTGQKIATDIALMATGAGATSAGLRALPGAQKLAATGNAGRFGVRAASEVGGGLVATGISQLQNPGQNFAESAAIGAAVDLALPTVGAITRGVRSANATRRATKATLNTPAGAVDKAVQNLDELQRAQELAARNKGEKTKLQQALQKVKEGFDPTQPLNKLDDEYAKSIGKRNRSELAAEEKMSYWYDRGLNSSRQVDDLLKTPTATKKSAYDILEKYGEAPEKGKKAASGAGAEFVRYVNNKFDLDYRIRNGRPIQKNVGDDDLASSVAAYEAKNPDALTDARTIKELNNQAIDIIADAGLITRADADVVKNSSEFAVPLERVFSENLERVQVGGRSMGSIGRQTVLQAIEGNSDIPLSSSFAPLIKRLEKAQKQANRNQLANLARQRFEQGILKGDLVTDPNRAIAREEIYADIADVQKDARKLERQVKITKRQATALERELNKLNKAGVTAATKPRPEVATTTPTGRPLKTNKLFETIVQTDPADLARIKKKIAAREPKLAAKIDELTEKTEGIAELTAKRKGLREELIEVKDAPTTGKQLISGLVDGRKFQIEVDADVARALQGLDVTAQPGAIKAIGGVTEVFRTAWTGFLNPIFTGVSNLFYDPVATAAISFIDNPSAFARSLAPKAIAESFKSVSSNAQFQRSLAREGAQLFGGSQLPQDAALSARDIASRGNFFKRAEFLTKNPKQLLRAADQWTGKLAGITRTRVARGYYDEAIKRGMDETSAIREAVYAYNNIGPNYARANQAVRNIDAILPYFSAGISGTRSLLQASKANPARAAGTFAAITGAFAGAAAYNLSTQEGQDFYKDMADSGRMEQLNNDIYLVMPGASKDPATGKWTGILRIPIPPEFRSLNKIGREQTQQFVQGQGASVGSTATALFDFMTGGIRTVENPLIDTIRITAGADPRSDLANPRPLIRGNMQDLPKDQQVFETTSEAAKLLSQITGRFWSPIQAEQVLGQFGFVGNVARGRDSGQQVVDRFTSSYAETTGRRQSEEYSLVNALRSQANKQINEQIAGNNVQGARQRAEEFNRTVDEATKRYAQTYGADSGLLTELNNLKINLTDRSIRSRQQQ